MKLAMIGTGGIAARHITAIRDHADGDGNVRFVAHVSRNQATADQAAQRWGGRGYTSVEEMLIAERPDAAFVCTIPADHGPTEFALIKAGVPFLVEKPIDLDGKIASKIERELRRSGVVAAVGYHWRAMDTIAELREMLAAKPPRMVLGRWHDSTPPPAWWRNQALSGGQMVEQATHLFDIARHLVGDAQVSSAQARLMPRDAYPDSDVADVSAAMLRYNSDATGIFTATCALSRGAAIDVQFICDGLLITLNQQGVRYEDSGDRFVERRNDPVATEDIAFLDAVRTGDSSKLFCSYADALATHKLCVKVQRFAARR